MTRTPLLLRADGDPLDKLRAVVERFERTARAARESHARSSLGPSGVGRGQSPLVVVAATGLDGLRLEHLDRDGVELLGDSELALAAERAGLSGFDLQGEDAERVRGALTAIRGSVGEHWVLDRLRQGILPVPEGAASAEMLPFTTPGIDLVFTNADGVEVGAANIKVAASADVVMRHFERYPDVSVVYATSDAAADAAARGVRVIGSGDMLPTGSPVVVDISHTSEQFDAQIREAIKHGGDHFGPIDDGAIEMLPWLSSGAIGVRALLRVRAGMPARDVARNAGREGVAAGTAATAAQLASRLTASEPSVALVAMVTSALTFGALDVRRSWTSLSDQLAYVARRAAQVADSACRVTT